MFFNNLAKNAQTSAVYQWEKFLRNLPFRMAIGKFGIQLMKVGRYLQVNYANWNSEFRLKVAYVPNPDMCCIHVSETVTTASILTFDSKDSQKNKQPPLVIEIFEVKGVSRVTLQPYEISITKGHVFTWQELLPQIESVILHHLTQK